MSKTKNPDSVLTNWYLENRYTYLPGVLYTHTNPVAVASPRLVIFNQSLAKSLGLPLIDTPPDELAQLFSGNLLPPHATPIAQAYAGHQFGHFAMLGDGRAHLLGEQLAPDGKRYDIQLKGSGQTAYSRRGDGRAALGPMLREYLISESMHALGIPTTRSLAVVTTGEPVFRDDMLQGAILTRVAASHIRVGTFEYAAAREDRETLKSLADYAINRHYPDLASHENRYLAFLDTVIERQATLIASWMHVGFIHGVMNTDNMTISGETIDYGPCAFMDRFAMDTVFSSIDRNGRYAYGNQAAIGQWNLARFAESLSPLLHSDLQGAAEIAETALTRYSLVFNNAWLSGMRRKLGLFGEEAEDLPLIQTLLEWMQKTGADYTASFFDLSCDNFENKNYQTPEFQGWYARWQQRRARNHQTIAASNELMRASNPYVIPRNQLVEDALEAAQQHDMKPFHALLAALQSPFTPSEANRPFHNAPAHTAHHYQTFCGT